MEFRLNTVRRYGGREGTEGWHFGSIRQWRRCDKTWARRPCLNPVNFIETVEKFEQCETVSLRCKIASGIWRLTISRCYTPPRHCKLSPCQPPQWRAQNKAKNRRRREASSAIDLARPCVCPTEMWREYRRAEESGRDRIPTSPSSTTKRI